MSKIKNFTDAVAYARRFFPSDSKSISISISLSLILGTSSVLGQRIFTKGELGITDFGASFFALVQVLFASLIVFLIVGPLLAWAKTYQGFAEKIYTTGVWGIAPWKRRLLFAFGFVTVWSAYWLVLWPGTITQDSFRQIIQALHLVPYSDHHPIAHTLVIESLLTPLLSLTGDIEVSLSIITAIQLMALAVLFALCIDAMRHFKLPKWILNSTYFLFLVHPLTGWYSISLWKDIWLSAFVLALGTATALLIYRYRRSERVSWKLWAIIFISIVAVTFSKKTGIVIVVPMILGTAFCFKGRDLRRWLSLGISACLVYLAGHALLITAFHVRPGSEVEAWSLPVQQIARTVSLHERELTPNHRKTISKFFTSENIGEFYQPGISDPIKNRLDEKYLKAHRPEFIKFWLELGREYPSDYIDAALNQTYGYWYPDVSYWMASASSWSDVLRFNAMEKRKDSVEKRVATSLYSELKGSPGQIVEPYAPELYPLNSIRRIPILGWLFSLGAWSWAALVLTAIAMVRRNVVSRSVSLLIGAVWVTCVLSPVFAEARYAYPILLLLPILAALAFARSPVNTPALELSRQEAGR